MVEIPTLESIREARQAISVSAIRTPLVRFQVTDAPAEIYLKLENLQPIGAFKIRGAANAIAHIPPDQLERGVLTASAGNMAQGVAWKARDLGIPCTVIAPEHAPEAKLQAIERLGARTIKVSFDEWWRTFERRAYPGVDGVYIHAFDDMNVMAGNGTIALEIVEDLPDVDTVIIPWGGGGLTCGIAAALRALKPECKIYAAEVETAAPLSASLAAGAPQTIQYQASFVDGIGSKTVFPEMFERAKQLIDGSLVATLDEVRSAVRVIAERNRVIAEGAGACPVACAVHGKWKSQNADSPKDIPPRTDPKKVACIVSGGNIDAAKLS
ncbi:MAG TPA: threonine/serine dehydratase, partial [Blastocatellia bacterium]|nr:threonine/serine dehydratase [Blastocatellia bacterium]